MNAGRTRLRLVSLGPVLLAVVPTIAFVAGRHPASTDFPEHTLAIGALRGLLLGHAEHTAFYTSNLATSPYLAYHALGALLATLLGSATLANRVLLVVVAAAFPLAFRRLVGALGGDRRLVWLSVMPFFSRALSIGFLPYLMSIPIGLVLVADAVNGAKVDPRERSAWLTTQTKLALLGTALFFSHLSSLTIFAPTAVLAVAVATWERGGTARARGVRLLLSSVWMVLPLGLVGRLALVGRLSTDVDHPVDAPAYMSLSRSLHALPLWVFDNYRHRWDDAAALGYWLVFSAAATYTVVRVVRGRVRIPLVRLVPLLVAVLVYLATPFRVGAALFLNVRLAPVLVLLALVPLRLPPLRLMTKAVAVVSALAGVVFVVSARACEAVEADGLPEVLGAIRPGASVLSLSFDRKPHLTYISAYLYPASERAADRGGEVGFSFASLPHWSIGYRRPQVRHRPFWVFAPCEFRNSTDGARYDYVLVRGARAPFERSPRGPRYELRAATGHYTLYERAPGSFDGADEGPCPRPGHGGETSAPYDTPSPSPAEAPR